MIAEHAFMYIHFKTIKTLLYVNMREKPTYTVYCGLLTPF